MADEKTAIVFYDIPLAEPNVTFSHNTWKTRYCLNYKGLPYRTEWVEYPDIEPLCIKLGAAPTGVKSDGVTPQYTLPVIYDPSTNRAISESLEIAVYLDATYPDTPRLLPPGTLGLQSAFADLVALRGVACVGDFVRPAVFRRLPPGKSQEFFRRTREARYGKKIEEIAPRGEARVTEWKKFERSFGMLGTFLDKAKDETEGEYMCGGSPSFADFVLAAFLQWCKCGFGPNSEEWNEISGWQNGRWMRLLDSLESLAKV